jgi:prepilin-type N-terminal cleavage/methylation domain-containing protein
VVSGQLPGARRGGFVLNGGGQWSDFDELSRVVVSGQWSGARRGGFTLIELLVVILIILIVSAVALPVVLPALSHRQVSEAARLLQGALVGARDSALKNGTPSGIRLMPDPAFPLTFLANGQIDRTQPLAANRIIPIEAAPEYSEGLLSVVVPNANDPNSNAYSLSVPYPQASGGLFYPSGVNSVNSGLAGRIGNVLMVKEQVVFNPGGGAQLNSPTSWYWNIRVGDKLQINGAGLWYTVVGPMVVPPQGATINGVFSSNSEQFVNVGPPGSQSPLQDLQAGVTVHPEFLFLVNGLDDNNNGWIDEGFDGVDNNLTFEIVNNSLQVIDEIAEWEAETWPATVVNLANKQYTIQRRPTPVANAREISLPTNVVIDMTMLLGSLPPTPEGSTLNQAWSFAERSQFPNGVIDPHTGYVDILLYPNGTVVPTTIYSSPSSFGMSGAFFHFWLAERSDVAAPSQIATQAPYLPVGTIKQQLISTTNPYTGPSLQGEYRIVSLFTRTGQVTSNDNVLFDNPANPANGSTYNPGYPFLATEQGARGGR